MDPESFEKGRYNFSLDRGKKQWTARDKQAAEYQRNSQENRAKREQYQAEQQAKKQRTWQDYSNIDINQVLATLVDYGYDPDIKNFWKLSKEDRKNILDESRHYQSNPRLKGLPYEGLYYDKSGPDADTRMANRRFHRGKQALNLLNLILSNDMKGAREFARTLDESYIPGETKFGDDIPVSSPSYLARQFENYRKYNEANATKDAKFTPEQVELVGKFLNGEIKNPTELSKLPLHNSLQQLLHIASFSKVLPEDESFKDMMASYNRGKKHFTFDPNKTYYAYTVSPGTYLPEGGKVFRSSPDFTTIDFGREYIGRKNYNPVILDEDLDTDDDIPSFKDMMNDRKKF